MIETQNFTKKFGDLTAVEGGTFRVEDGEVFGFLGMELGRPPRFGCFVA